MHHSGSDAGFFFYKAFYHCTGKRKVLFVCKHL